MNLLTNQLEPHTEDHYFCKIGTMRQMIFVSILSIFTVNCTVYVFVSDRNVAFSPAPPLERCVSVWGYLNAFVSALCRCILPHL